MNFSKIVCSVLVASIIFGVSRDAFAAGNDALAKAKQQAESKGYVFYSTHDEIVAKAKERGGELRVLAEMEPGHIKDAMVSFKKKYPFLDIYIEEITGTDQARRNILEIKSGAAKDWDILHLSSDFYSEYLPYLAKIDILGMAEQSVLRISPPMVDPINRNVAAFFSRFQVTAYNKNLISRDRVPTVWEDFLKPEFKGKKFAADIRPTEVAALIPAWGLEKTLDFARKIAAQEPLWVRGGSRTLTAMMGGEVALFLGPNFHTTRRAMGKDPTGVIQYVLTEPVPLRMALFEAVQKDARNPHAALLWLEWMASPEAQKQADEHEPLGSSVYVRGGAVEQELRGKKLSVVSWQDVQKMDDWQAKVFEAYGFPKAERKR
jgi:ABC-type Fe3+ transport system substrate-binding protein